MRVPPHDRRRPRAAPRLQASRRDSPHYLPARGRGGWRAPWPTPDRRDRPGAGPVSPAGLPAGARLRPADRLPGLPRDRRAVAPVRQRAGTGRRARYRAAWPRPAPPALRSCAHAGTGNAAMRCWRTRCRGKARNFGDNALPRPAGTPADPGCRQSAAADSGRAPDRRAARCSRAAPGPAVPCGRRGRLRMRGCCRRRDPARGHVHSRPAHRRCGRDSHANTPARRARSHARAARGWPVRPVPVRVPSIPGGS